MTNFDRALAVLEAARRPGELRIHPHDAVEVLAEAGLLAPELPKPKEADDDYVYWACEHSLSDSVYIRGRVDLYIDTDSEIHVPGNDHYGLILDDPDEARVLGLALLAAANYLEGKK